MVVLLARDPGLGASLGALKELDLDASQWQPLVQDKAFLPWLVKVPDGPEARRARFVSTETANRLEALWKAGASGPAAGRLAAQLAAEEAACAPVALRYADAFQYQSVFGPLLALEAEHDRGAKEAQSRDGISVRWDVGLNKRRLACFVFPKDEAEARLAPGDDLRLRHRATAADGAVTAWEGVGSVVKLTPQEEVVLELRQGGGAPVDCTTGFRARCLQFGFFREFRERAGGERVVRSRRSLSLLPVHPPPPPYTG